jgi:hypothetical protein
MAINIGRVLKDPDDVMDIPIDWEPYLMGATILSGTSPDVPDGIMVVSSTPYNGTTMIHRVSGGTVGEEYNLTTRVVPTSGGQLDLEFTVAVV